MPNANDRNPAKSTGARLALGLFVTLITLGSVWLYRQSTVTPDLVLPVLTTQKKTGSKVFHENCAPCHGDNATGGPTGPPLIHRYYEASLHGDATFYDAVHFDAAAHHWNFGDMSPVSNMVTNPIDDMEEEKIAAIVAWIRILQTANGILGELR